MVERSVESILIICETLSSLVLRQTRGWSLAPDLIYGSNQNTQMAPFWNFAVGEFRHTRDWRFPFCLLIGLSQGGPIAEMITIVIAMLARKNDDLNNRAIIRKKRMVRLLTMGF
jgi:hypothetical protein